MPHSGGFARASLRWTRPRLTRRPRAAQHPAPQRGERVMTWSVKDDVECGRLHSTSSLALHVAKRPSAPAENRPIAVLSHSTLGGSVVRCQIRTPRWATQAWRCQIRTPRWATQAWRCKIRTPRWATQAWRRQTAATAAHRPAHRRHTNPPDCSVRGMYVEHRGFEPLTSSMPWRRATNCANAPLSRVHSNAPAPLRPNRRGREDGHAA